MARLVSWRDRLEYLIDHYEYLKAFEIAQSFYEGSMSYAVSGIPENQEKREESIGSFIETMIIKYLNQLGDPLSQTQSDLQGICDMLFSVAIKIGKIDLIFEHIHDFFHKSNLLKIYVSFLDC